MHRSLGVAILLCAILLLTTYTVTHAQFSFIDVIRDGDEGKVDGLNTPSHVVISPDNKFLYVAGAGDNAIAVFERDTLSSKLTFIEAVKNGENGVDGLAGVREITISADGQYLYAVADVDNAITTFSRNEENGKLAFLQMLKDEVDGVDGLEGARALAMSPDGDNIYVAAFREGAITVFFINKETGLLTFAEAIHNGEKGATKLNTPNSVVVSPDSLYVYVTDSIGDGICVFSRDTNDQGKLSHVQNINNWAEYNFLGTLIGNARPTNIVISNNGEKIYVSGYGGTSAGNLTLFSRDISTGLLNKEKGFADNATFDSFNFTLLDRLGRLTSLILTPDQKFLYTTGHESPNGNGNDIETDYRINWFSRNLNTGALTPKPEQGIENGHSGIVEGLEKPCSITFSKDGNFFYVVSEENALTIFSVFFPSIASFSPQEGYTDTEVSITGDDFGNVQGGSTVKFGDVTAEVVTWSNTEIIVKVPQMDGGEVDINVTVNNIIAPSPEKFTVIESLVVINEFAPSGGKTGTTVGIKGTNFGTGSDERKVFFGDIEATDIVWISSDSVTAVVPVMEDGSVKIRIMVNDEVGISNSDFIVDKTSPMAVITYNDADRKVQVGEIITVTATFNEPVADDPAMEIAFIFEGQEDSFLMTKVSETVYIYDYEVGEEDGQVSIQLQGGTDVYGNIVEAIPENNAFFIDNIPPEAIFSPGQKEKTTTDTPITISFNETVRNIDNAAISSEDVQQIIALTKILKDTEEAVSFSGRYNEIDATISINPESLDANEVYQVKVRDSVLEDEADNAVADTLIKFTTGNYNSLDPKLDTILLDQANKGKITINVNDTNLVRTAQLYVRGIQSCQDWQEPFNLALDTEVHSFYHTFDPIPDSIGIEYKYTLTDKFDSTYIDSSFLYKGFEKGINVDVQGGESQNAYQIISFPLELDSSDVSQVLDELGTYNKKNWRLFTVGNTGEFIEYPDFQSVNPGEAYLLIYKDANIATINTGKGHTVDVHKEKPFEIPVHRGWNLIGNPFNFDIPWDTIIDFQNEENIIMPEEIRDYSENWLKISDTLLRGGGSLVFIHDNISFINIPVSCIEDVSGGRKKESYEHKNKWEIPLSLEQGNGSIKRTIAGFGMHPTALASRDQYDVMSPPHFGKYLDVNFHHSEYFYPYFAKDIVPLQDSHIWEFNVETNIATDLLTLSWNEKDLPADGKQIYLMDVSKNKVVDMHNNPSYSFHTTNSNKFKIFYGMQGFIDANVYPNAVSLHVNYPNPFYEHTSIPFTIPKSEKGYHVKMHIYHISGKQVVTLKDEVVHSGFYEIRWNGTDASGHKMKGGIYICELVAVDGERVVKEEKRLLLLGP